MTVSHRRLFHRLLLPCGLLAPALIAADLDPDGNGLYDDAERLVLTTALAAACPELPAIVDADGDGRLTIAEQTAGRHPLSQLVPRDFPTRGARIPWGIDIFPEWIMNAYVQEDVAPGAVATLTARGVAAAPATVVEGAPPPERASGRDGVVFPSGSRLSMAGRRDAQWDYRWCLFTFRIDGASAAADETVLVDINHGEAAGQSTPRISWHRGEGLRIHYAGLREGVPDRRVIRSEAVVADGTTWNVVVCGIRQGRLWAQVNGVDGETTEPQGDRFGGGRVPDRTSFLGDAGAGTATWALDALVFGLTEPSQAMVAKLSGWGAHRLGVSQNLPASHPYHSQRPILDGEDLPHRYVHDDEAWTAWGKGLSKDATRVNSGGERVSPQGFEVVFRDDFTAKRIGHSATGDEGVWMAPGFNPAVGASIPLNGPDDDPDVYPHDPAAGLQTLSLDEGGRGWRASAFYSINDLGQGYTWAGPKIFRIRCRFPAVAQKDLAGGLFPAFWSYGTEVLSWRTSNRIEVDWFEFDGQNGRWYNGLSSHYHYPHVKSIFAKRTESYQRYKIYSGELTEERIRVPGGLYFWDGKDHTWEFVVDADTTYVNVTVPTEDGGERWVEICRCPTPAPYLEPLDLQLDYALKSRKNSAPVSGRQDFIVDWVEVEQKTSQIEAVPAPFAARPVISGEPVVGQAVHCEVDIPGVSDLRYFWFVDADPRGFSSAATFTPDSADRGKTLRCLVLAAGARDQPQAWTAPVVLR